MELIIASIIFALAIITAAFLLLKRPSSPGLPESLRQLNEQQSQQMQQTINLILQQLNRHQESQERTSHLMHNRIDVATKVVSEVQGKLLQLEEANKRIFDLGKDISSLQKILQAPKLRGGMGEVWLAEIIGQIIPRERYKMQYTFKTGDTCDAVIFLKDGTLLPIDSKFSLENFSKMLDASEEQKNAFRRIFVADVKKRVEEIAKKYILPEEGTLEFAFMYVPAENVYYQAFIQDQDDMQLLNFAFSKKVIPVSPSSFYAYLNVILFGLRGLEIEKSAKEIHKNLVGLQGEFGKFRLTFDKVGTHLRHAQQGLDLSDKKLENIENKFLRISSSSPNLPRGSQEIPDEIQDQESLKIETNTLNE